MTQRLLLGCIADDFTGATDVANNLVRAGMRVTQLVGVPDARVVLDPDTDAVVIALKSRTIAPALGVEQSLRALHWLKALGTRQIYFKYCSTFDSTAQGNIGPVTEALMDALDCRFTIVVPSFPEAGRTVYQGHLFVGGALLSESGMQNHPLTPMTDANLVRVMQAQSTRRVGLIHYATVALGHAAMQQAAARLMDEGAQIAIVDTVSNADLLQIAKAFADLPLLTAGSGLAIGLAANFGIASSEGSERLPPPRGARAIVSGSCSLATNRQVRHFIESGGEAFALDPLRAQGGADIVAEALAWATPRLGHAAVLIYSTADTGSIARVRDHMEANAAGELLERAAADVATGLVARGVGQLVIAGGETSGACISALNVRQLRIGKQIAPGVPWCHASDIADGGLHVALKSGNFGADDFFSQAFEVLA